MGQTLQIGPFTLAWVLIVLLTGWLAGTWLAEHLARKRGIRIERHIWLIALAGLLAARLAFVAQYASAYASSQWSIVDIRDGGWEPMAGLAAIGVYVLALWVWHSASARAVTAGAALFTAIWLGGSTALSLLAPQNTTLPQFTGVALDAQSLSLPDLKGQPVVINLWATWCPPCRREMPVLMDAQKAHPGVRFVYVNQGEKPDAVLRYVQQIGMAESSIVLDPQEALSRMVQQRALPTTLFFNAQGRQVAVRSGELSKATLAQHLEQIDAPR
ncbi:TlpA disulfide reductase family protein [Diaphorobacter aerolatus]|uniref:TlpA family protein disulfide reductase n=1 Tax=Diaphorobacter aerolatus TaxID=1288495 RepID=A0A7H0GLT5_9BURK|nr:TlpA disulfide reductase family protein [Diaphorobacter aerolatus]QNP49251.1 TlpA family protein disulfide reductase [Diaphorobacter aerolatus]